MILFDENGNIKINRGDTLYYRFNVLLEGVEFDWTGCTVKWRLKIKTFDSVPLMEYMSGSGIDSSIAGTLIIGSNKDEITLEPGHYLYDLIFTDAEGVVSTWLNNKSFEIINY